MDVDPRNGIQILDTNECRRLLAKEQLGRLAVAPGGRPDIFPVNYLYHHGQIVFRTGEGSKLSSLAVNHAVAFEVDGLDVEVNEAWSVVVVGVARLITADDVSVVMESLPLQPWNTAPKLHFVEIFPQRISGRRFVAEGRLTGDIPAQDATSVESHA